MKEKLKAQLRTVTDSAQEGDATAEMRRDFLRLYLKRTNELIARMEKDIAGDRAFARSDEDVPSAAQQDRNVARYDKFVFGAAASYDSQGDRQAVTEKLLTFADEMEKQRKEVLLHRDDSVRAKGLDPEKLFAQEVDAAQIKTYVEEVLAAYGWKSDISSETYVADRVGPAIDGKWQVVIDENATAMSVNGVQKVVKIPRGRKYTMAQVISVACAHEVEGHVVQSENRQRMPLALFKEVRGDRSEMYMEAGAMHNQNAISQELFGYGQFPHPHYARALVRRIEGGDYAQCVQAFFDSAMRETDALRNAGRMDDAAYAREREANLCLAINRTLRLFRGAQSLAGGAPTSSKDLVYLEQLQAMRALREHRADQYAFVAGVTVDAARILKKWGFLDDDTITRPQMHSKEVWQRVREDYALTH